MLGALPELRGSRSAGYGSRREALPEALLGSPGRSAIRRLRGTRFAGAVALFGSYSTLQSVTFLTRPAGADLGSHRATVLRHQLSDDRAPGIAIEDAGDGQVLRPLELHDGIARLRAVGV